MGAKRADGTDPAPAGELDELLEEVRRTASDVSAYAVQATREQPLVAVGMAAVFGFVVGGGFLERSSGKLVTSALQALAIKAIRDRLVRGMDGG